MGLAYGLTQLAQFAGFSALFWAAGKFIDEYKDEPEPLDPQYVFIAIFALMFGAQHAGFA